MAHPRVFLDTSAVKHSIRRRPAFERHSFGMQTWGDQTFEAFWCEPVEEDPTAQVSDEPLRTEIDLLARVAALARNKEIELLWHHESQLEFWRTFLAPGGGSSELLEAGVTMVGGPIQYVRMDAPIIPFSESTRALQISFFRELKDERFLELQAACGAYQGANISERQLIDAFHVWCAEAAGATHFLTTDLKLVRIVHQRKKSPPRVRVVSPSELLADIAPQKNSA